MFKPIEQIVVVCTNLHARFSTLSLKVAENMEVLKFV